MIHPKAPCQLADVSLPSQILAVVLLQIVMLVYLVTVKPFVDSGLHVVEVACHSLEAVLFACAAALVLSQPSMQVELGLQWAMIGEAMTGAGECLCEGTARTYAEHASPKRRLFSWRGRHINGL
jgi:hypothetical protein